MAKQQFDSEKLHSLDISGIFEDEYHVSRIKVKKVKNLWKHLKSPTYKQSHLLKTLISKSL